MSNPFSGIITADHKRLYSNMIKATIELLGLSVPCRVYFAPTKGTQCPNCKKNPITGKSAGIYLAGGPIAFNNGNVCPYCQGEGIKQEIPTDDLVLAVIYEPKNFIKVGGLQKKDGGIQTISLITTLPVINRAKEVIVNTNVEDYIKNRYIKDGEPVLLGEGLSDESFVVCHWTKV